jgi:hypothetical protein
MRHGRRSGVPAPLHAPHEGRQARLAFAFRLPPSAFCLQTQNFMYRGLDKASGAPKIQAGNFFKKKPKKKRQKMGKKNACQTTGAAFAPLCLGAALLLAAALAAGGAAAQPQIHDYSTPLTDNDFKMFLSLYSSGKDLSTVNAAEFLKEHNSTKAHLAMVISKINANAVADITKQKDNLEKTMGPGATFSLAEQEIYARHKPEVLRVVTKNLEEAQKHSKAAK